MRGLAQVGVVLAGASRAVGTVVVAVGHLPVCGAVAHALVHGDVTALYLVAADMDGPRVGKGRTCGRQIESASAAARASAARPMSPFLLVFSMAHLSDLSGVGAHAPRAVDRLCRVPGGTSPVSEGARVVAVLLGPGAPRCCKGVLDPLRHDLHHVLHALAVRVGDGAPPGSSTDLLSHTSRSARSGMSRHSGPLKRDASTKSGLNS